MFYFAYFILLIALSIYGYSKGDIKAFLAPVSRTGQICGETDVSKGFPYLYFNINLKSNDSLAHNAFCVSKCPTEADLSYSCFEPGCQAGPNVYPTVDLLYICVPKDAPQEIMDKINESSLGHQFKNLKVSTKYLLACLGISIVLNVIWIYMMSMCPSGLAKMAVLFINLFWIAMAAAFIYFGRKNS